jgi:hypothetical protein
VFSRTHFKFRRAIQAESAAMGRRQKNIIYPRAAVLAARNHPRASSDSIIICPDDDRRYPSRQQWSELQRDDRIAAECASHQLPRNKLSLCCWQAVAAKAALPRSCSDHYRMPIHRTRRRRSRLQIGPTSRTRDSVWFLFPCRDFDPTRNLSKLIPRSTSYFSASRSQQPLQECFSRSTESVRGGWC